MMCLQKNIEHGDDGRVGERKPKGKGGSRQRVHWQQQEEEEEEEKGNFQAMS